MKLHLFLIWHNAINYYSYIMQKLVSSFQIVKVFETIWDKEKTLDNMQKMYNFSLQEAENKLFECGYGKVFIIIVNDKNYSEKPYLTKYGILAVSKNAQEIKEEIRKGIGNFSIFHGTMLDFEFENDIAVCLGCSKDKFINSSTNEWDGRIWKI